MNDIFTLKKAYQKPPCKNCENRYVGCHSSCKDYISYREGRNEYLESRYKESTINNIAFPPQLKQRSRET